MPVQEYCRAVYIAPVENLAEFSAEQTFWSRQYPSVTPNFDVDRSQALLIIGTRAGIMHGLRAWAQGGVRIADGALQLTVKAGGPGVGHALEKAGRAAGGAIAGVASATGGFLAKPFKTLAAEIDGRVVKGAGALFRGDAGMAVNQLKHGGTPDPFFYRRGFGGVVQGNIDQQVSKTSHAPFAMVQIACAASNAFAAAARQRGPRLNSNFSCNVLYDMLAREHGFPRD